MCLLVPRGGGIGGLIDSPDEGERGGLIDSPEGGGGDFRLVVFPGFLLSGNSKKCIVLYPHKIIMWVAG